MESAQRRAPCPFERSLWPGRAEAVGVVLLLAVLPILSSCESKPNASSSVLPETSDEAPNTSELADSAPAPMPHPVDLDLGALEKNLSCGRGSVKAACDVVEQFVKASHFDGKTPSGESRWLGRAQVVEGGKARTEYWALYLHTVPTARVGAGALPLMVGMAPIPTRAHSHASRVFGTLSRGKHRAKSSDPILRMLEEFQPKDERALVQTTGVSAQTIEAVSEDVAFLRQPELKKLLVIRPALGGAANAGDGIYMEFWQTTW